MAAAAPQVMPEMSSIPDYNVRVIHALAVHESINVGRGSHPTSGEVVAVVEFSLDTVFAVAEHPEVAFAIRVSCAVVVTRDDLPRVAGVDVLDSPPPCARWLVESLRLIRERKPVIVVLQWRQVELVDRVVQRSIYIKIEPPVDVMRVDVTNATILRC